LRSSSYIRSSFLVANWGFLISLGICISVIVIVLPILTPRVTSTGIRILLIINSLLLRLLLAIAYIGLALNILLLKYSSRLLIIICALALWILIIIIVIIVILTRPIVAIIIVLIVLLIVKLILFLFEIYKFFIIDPSNVLHEFEIT